MLDRLVGFFREAQSHTGMTGVSSTKVVWLWAGLGSLTCASICTIAGVVVYCCPKHTADPVFWTATGALWVNTLGFAGMVQKAQNKSASAIVSKATPEAEGQV